MMDGLRVGKDGCCRCWWVGDKSDYVTYHSWSFVGPTTAYAFMQSMGMVNDRVEGCEWRDRTKKLRQQFKRPTI